MFTFSRAQARLLLFIESRRCIEAKVQQDEPKSALSEYQFKNKLWYLKIYMHECSQLTVSTANYSNK